MEILHNKQIIFNIHGFIIRNLQFVILSTFNF